VVTLAGR